MIKTANLVLLGLILAGCGSVQLYEGQRLPENEIVIVKGFKETELVGIGAVICAFDGIQLDPCRTLIEIPPGVHSLSIRSFSKTFQTIKRKVEIDSNPGDRYQIDAEFKIENGYLNPVIRKVGNANDE